MSVFLKTEVQVVFIIHMMCVCVCVFVFHPQATLLRGVGASTLSGTLGESL